MNKKKYEAPVVKRVKLEVKNSILSVCFSSLITDPSGLEIACRINGVCANPV
ncbi:MAG: hypothetical protein RQ728_06195 [Brevefilum sp.]|nr:hypothetical protein [Brevefilum sp.]MDT8381830.1 hypothetical protein [Brevefilum sp.]